MLESDEGGRRVPGAFGLKEPHARHKTRYHPTENRHRDAIGRLTDPQRLDRRRKSVKTQKLFS